jgi:hypothetical protein
MRANLPALIRGAVPLKSVSFIAAWEHVRSREGYASANEREHDDSDDCLRNLQRHACLIYGSPHSSPKLGQKVVIVA